MDCINYFVDNSFLHGTKEEMLGVLFLLFAEAIESEEIVEDSSSSPTAHSERKSTESESGRPTTTASTPTVSGSLSTKDSSKSTASKVVAKTTKTYLTGILFLLLFYHRN